MLKRSVAAVTAAVLLGTQAMAGAASADNKMGYQLETPQQAGGLTRAGGSLGMRVGPEQEITSEGLSFELLKVEDVGQRSPAAQAGLSAGDRIIAVNGHVFPDTSTFAAFVGAVPPGHQIEGRLHPLRRWPRQGATRRRHSRRQGSGRPCTPGGYRRTARPVDGRQGRHRARGCGRLRLLRGKLFLASQEEVPGGARQIRARDLDARAYPEVERLPPARAVS